MRNSYTFYEEIHGEQNVIEYEGDLYLVIRGGELSYSTPRAEVLPEEYSEMEVAVIKNNSFQSFKDILQTNKYEEYLGGYFSSGVNAPYGFVPVDLVEEIYLAMNQKYKRNV